MMLVAGHHFQSPGQGDGRNARVGVAYGRTPPLPSLSYDATVSIESIVYVRGKGSVSATLADASRASQESGSLAWVRLVEPDESDFGVISDSFGLEPPLLEEAARFPHRSDIERHENRLVAVLPMLQASGGEDDSKGGFGPVESDWVLVLAVAGPNMIVTLTDDNPPVLDRLRRSMEGTLDRLAE